MLERLSLAASSADDPEIAALAAAFPTVSLETNPPASLPWIPVDLAVWTAPLADLGELDDRVRAAAAVGAFGLWLVGASPAAGRAGLEVLTRYQRFVCRRNRASEGALFDRVLASHRALFDRDEPLVRADFEHALDTWQWLLRLDPAAGIAVQASALFHDVERLESEAVVRVEHRARSYDAFKDAHARRGAAMARACLAGVGLAASELDRLGALVEGHERPSWDPELALLNEADALSFFSLNSEGFVDYYGAEHARMKVARSLARLGPRGRRALDGIRYRADVRALLQRALDAGAA